MSLSILPTKTFEVFRAAVTEPCKQVPDLTAAAKASRGRLTDNGLGARDAFAAHDPHIRHAAATSQRYLLWLRAGRYLPRPSLSDQIRSRADAADIAMEGDNIGRRWHFYETLGLRPPGDPERVLQPLAEVASVKLV